MKPILFITLFTCLAVLSFAQPTYTANELVKAYHGNSYYGTNPGYHVTWTDKELGNIAAGNPSIPEADGVGVNTLRPSIPQHFLEFYGYDILVDEFEHYDALGLKDNVAFIGYPNDANRDWTHYCPSAPSENFKDIYEPIWDNGENGTPVNDNNPYALYVYKMSSRYAGFVKFYEVWNEPDLDTGGTAWLPSGQPGNWWENNPDPCDFKMKCPIMHYVRLLRITYEVVKTVDPDAYVALGGIGFPSFLDAVLRNSDNPADGSVTPEYPKNGGAYFDCMSYHSYPHIDGSLREWNNSIGGFQYFNHSDRAVQGMISRKFDFKNILDSYGYNGNTYPEKVWIITETNIPRAKVPSHPEYIGSDEAQRNFTIKALVEGQKHNISQLHWYNLGEASAFDANADSEFGYMGLYKKLEGTLPYEQRKTNSGVAFKTTSTLLKDHQYDALRTAQLQMPNDVNGGAFKSNDGSYTYVMWAVTSINDSEYASATYSFPADLNISKVDVKNWKYTDTEIAWEASAVDLPLTGAPLFLRDANNTQLPIGLLTFTGRKFEADVQLDWLTENEENNAYFSVQHSVDGRDFNEIAKIEGAGTSTEPHAYHYLHEQPRLGKNYYRLKQYDFDGSFSYSDIVIVDFDAKDIVQISSSITMDFIYLEFYEIFDYDIEIELFDAVGRKIDQAILSAGENYHKWDTRNLVPGTYMVRLKIQEEGYFSQKFVKARA